MTPLTSSMVSGKKVRLKPETADNNGRTFALVFVDGTNLNEQIVAAITEHPPIADVLPVLGWVPKGFATTQVELPNSRFPALSLYRLTKG